MQWEDSKEKMSDSPLENLRNSKALKQKGKRAIASTIHQELSANGYSETLNVMLDDLLRPDKDFNDSDIIEWCKWIIASGKSPNDFSSQVRSYDNHAKCGLVWVPHVVAYRCRTCGTSPCMSICRDCFKRGNHKNHDFNMFLSQAGGACDCGDTSVMKAEGFCSDHGIDNRTNKGPVPPDLMCVAQATMPRLLLRLLLYFRDHHSIRGHSYNYERTAKDCDDYCSMLMYFNNMGELMRRIMTRTLIDPEMYKKLVHPPFSKNVYGAYMTRSNQKYEEAVRLFPCPEPPAEYEKLPALGKQLVHKTLLEEFIFWTFKYEFPQNVVCFLLNMLPDQDYKEHLTRTFVMHYSRIPSVLEMSEDPDTMSNRVVHVSVQLFSNEALALKMVEELNLLHVMIISLKSMVSKILIPNTLHDPDKNFHYVVDCAKKVMREHCYWPLVSDFNNVLSHERVAQVFLKDDNLIDMWFQFLSMLQGMNVNIRETTSHVEFEPSSYYAAFSCELEASAYPMWSIISHLKDKSYAELSKKIMNYLVNYLQEWLDAVNFSTPRIEKDEMLHASFHFPLHRYLAAFLYQAVKTMNISLNDILPEPETIKLLMMHPLRVQSLFYEVLSGIWVRNGLQIKGQAMTYIQANFCNSMVDMDLFFLQICATQLPASFYLTSCIDSFGVNEWFFQNLTSTQEMEHDSMMEGMLTFLATLITSRTNLGNDEDMKCIVEISALLTTSDKTHSQLLELMPERSGNPYAKNFEKYLKLLSSYRPPPVGSENLEQGLFIPLPIVWNIYYDPLHVLLRAVHRRDFQNSLDRFSAYVTQQNKMPKSGNLWPPFRLPNAVGAGYTDPSCVLNTKVFHSIILGILYRAVNVRNVSEHLMALAIFLLELAVTKTNKDTEKSTLECNPRASSTSSTFNNSNMDQQHKDIPDLFNCYPGNNLYENLALHVTTLTLGTNETQNSPANYQTQFDSDIEWELSESDAMPMLIGSVDHDYAYNGGLDVAVPQDLSIVRENSEDLSSPPVRTNQLLPIMSSESSVAVVEYSNNAEPQEEQRQLAINSTPAISAGSNNMELVVRRETSQSEVISDGLRPNRSPQELFYSSGTTNNISGVILPFNRVQPVAVPNQVQSMDVVPSVSTSTTFRRRMRNLESQDSTDAIKIDDSILSLLLKLHSQLSGTLDSFSLEDDDDVIISDNAAAAAESNSSSSHQYPNSIEPRIGDGPFFIGNLLRKIARVDEKCAQNINEIRQRLWPNQRERQAEQKAREAKEKEERTKRARERQQKVMEEFANKQKQFMATAANLMEGIDDDENDVEEAREKEYDCIICNCTGPSTESNPICLVVLVESSSIVGHRRKSPSRFPLPVCDEDKEIPGRNVRLSSEFRKRAEILGRKYGTQWFLTHNICWEGGVHVQSCGHHVHLTCHESYLKSLAPTRPQNLNIEHGEFSCPRCRQLANSVLPLSPQLDRPTSVIRNPAPDFDRLCVELMELIKDSRRPNTTSKLEEAMVTAMESMTNSTRNIKKYHAEALYQNPPTNESLFAFVTSVARTNLESEVIQRGGSLCTYNDIRYRPKRECIVPLLHVLSFHVRLMINSKNYPFGNQEWSMDRTWASLCGITNVDFSVPVPSYSSVDKMPSLITDPSAQLIKYLLLAPLQLDQGRS
ncbi:hypothetical protein ACKWTF_003079 [Chironomus riparius]